jgi:hypothetical protein
MNYNDIFEIYPMKNGFGVHCKDTKFGLWLCSQSRDLLYSFARLYDGTHKQKLEYGHIRMYNLFKGVGV